MSTSRRRPRNLSWLVPGKSEEGEGTRFIRPSCVSSARHRRSPMWSCLAAEAAEQAEELTVDLCSLNPLAGAGDRTREATAQIGVAIKDKLAAAALSKELPRAAAANLKSRSCRHRPQGPRLR